MHSVTHFGGLLNAAKFSKIMKANSLFPATGIMEDRGEKNKARSSRMPDMRESKKPF